MQMPNPTPFLKIVEELVFKLSTLVAVNGLWESKSLDKVIVQFISSRFGGLVTGSIRLGKSIVQ